MSKEFHELRQKVRSGILILCITFKLLQEIKFLFQVLHKIYIEQ